MPTIAEALHAARVQLAPLHENARLDAELLLAHVVGRARSYLIAWPEHRLTDAESQQFTQLLARRSTGEPVAHILGRREFWSLDLYVTPATLIPRPETELLVDLALARIPVDAPWEVADLGTGSGAIALAIARERPRCRITATDMSEPALAVACGNAQRLGIGNIDFQQGHWYAGLEHRQFHLILTNPPYIRAGDPHLQQGDVRFDPLSALVSGTDGLDDLRIIVAGAPAHLHPGGWLLVEHGYDQADAVARLFAAAGFSAVVNEQDLAGQPRVTLGMTPTGPDK